MFGLCYTAEYALIKQKREGEQELLSSDGEQFETITIKRQFWELFIGEWMNDEWEQ